MPLPLAEVKHLGHLNGGGGGLVVVRRFVVATVVTSSTLINSVILWRVGFHGASGNRTLGQSNVQRVEGMGIISILRESAVVGPVFLGGAGDQRGMDAVLVGEHADGGQCIAGGGAIAEPSAHDTDAPSIPGSRAERASILTAASAAIVGPCECTATEGESELGERCAGRERGREHRG